MNGIYEITLRAPDGQERTPLDGRQLKRYIASMREVVEAYKMLLFAANAQKRG